MDSSQEQDESASSSEGESMHPHVECDELADAAERGARAVLDALAREISALDVQIARLGRFLELMGDEFDEAERAHARELCESRTALREEKRALMRERLDIYERDVVRTKERLDARKRVINDADVASLLETSPTLMTVVVERHAALTRQIEQATAVLTQ